MKGWECLDSGENCRIARDEMEGWKGGREVFAVGAGGRAFSGRWVGGKG